MPIASGTTPTPASGAPPGFDDLARRERPGLVAFAWSLTGDGGAAEELAQEALLAAYQSWDRIGAYDKPGAFLRKVVANGAVDRLRRRGREATALARMAARPAPVVQLEPEDRQFWEAVRALPERQAQAVALFYLEDRPVAEIADILGCATSTAKVHLHRGRIALARTLGLLAGEQADEPTDDEAKEANDG